MKAHCINIGHPEYQELLKTSNMSSAMLSAKVAVWQMKNSMDAFPSLEELVTTNTINYQLSSTEGQIASEKTIRDLAARMSDRIGMDVIFESDRSKEYKGKIENGKAVVNLAYATLDTPVHEILGHPIIRAIKNRNFITEEYIKNAEFGYELEGLSKIEINKKIEELKTQSKNQAQLYQNLLKELEYGRGKEVLDRVKRDYQYKDSIATNITSDKGSFKSSVSVKKINDKYEVIDSNIGTVDVFDSFEEARNFAGITEYTLEEQKEEAIVELLGLMTAEKLDNIKDGKLISLLKRLLKEMKQFVRSLLNQKEVEIDKLPDNMTIEDIANLLAYSNSKLILPGYEVEYSTPDNQKFKTYQEANKHISQLIKNVNNIDLNNIEILKPQKIIDPTNNKEILNVYSDSFISDWGVTHIVVIKYSDNTIEEHDYDSLPKEQYDFYRNIEFKNGQNYLINDFVERNKWYEQSKEIIEEWKKINNIQYNPEEIYSRGQEFSSVVGAYSSFDVNLMMQNLLSHIEDNEKAGGKFAISAYTKPIDKTIGHLEGGGGKIKFKIYPQSQDILWAANIDVYSGSVWDASEKINKDKKSELLGVSYTKYPSIDHIDAVQPNLASIVDDIAHHHNELGIVLTGNNFRLEYDENIPYGTKKIIDSINSILDQKYGKLIKPEIKSNKFNKGFLNTIINRGYVKNIEKQNLKENYNVDILDSETSFKHIEKIKNVLNQDAIAIQPTQTKDNLKESINSVKDKILEYETALTIYTNKLNDYNGDLLRYENNLKKYEDNQNGIIDKHYSNYTDLNGKLNKKIKVFAINLENTINEVGMWQNEEDYDTVKDYIVKEEKNIHDVKFWILSNEFKKEALKSIEKPKKPEQFNLEKPKPENYKIKEYTEQALINTKIAALKEVAKKYPRSLIRSEVKKNIFLSSQELLKNDELPFQKITTKNRNTVTKAESTTVLKEFWNAIGLEVNIVDKILDHEGRVIPDATGIAKITSINNKIVNTINIRQDAQSLVNFAEETAHIYTGLLGMDHPLYKAMEARITKEPEYANVKKLYPEIKDENIIRFEAIGQVIANIIAETNTSEKNVVWWKAVMKAIENLFKNIFKSPFKKAAFDILEGNVARLNEQALLAQEELKQQEQLSEQQKLAAEEYLSTLQARKAAIFAEKEANENTAKETNVKELSKIEKRIGDTKNDTINWYYENLDATFGDQVLFMDEVEKYTLANLIADGKIEISCSI